MSNMEKQTKTVLREGYYLFGGRGDVWEDTAHIAKSGSHTTMCGKSMLSSNWVRLEGIENAGCAECLKLYGNEQSK